MRNYDASQWANGGKATSLSLTTKDTIELDVVSPGSILIVGITSDGEAIPIIAAQNHIHVKHKFEGFERLDLTSNKDMGIRSIHKANQQSEPTDDKAPPPPKEPTNILQQMRSVIKQELATNRESFLENDTGLPGHEVDDDDDNFEEEMFEKALDKAAKSEDIIPPPPQSEAAAEKPDESEPQSIDETNPSS